MMHQRISSVLLEPTGAPGTAVARWVDHRQRAATDKPIYRVYLDSLLAGETSDTQWVLHGLRPDGQAEVDVLEISGADKGIDKATPMLFVRPARGGRLWLTWPQVDASANPDFAAYRLYWDAGTLESASELLTELQGAESTTYTTQELQDDFVYRFRLTLVDVVGNESAVGAETSSVVNSQPEAPSLVSLTYSPSTRSAVIYYWPATAQDVDDVFYALYSNNAPGYGLQPAIVFGAANRISTTGLMPGIGYGYGYAESQQALTVTGLYEGMWVFAVRACDRTGYESDYMPITLNLKLIDNQLVEVVTPPAVALVDAYAIVGGVIRAEILVDEEAATAADNVWLWLDGVPTVSVPFVEGTQTYLVDTGILVDAQEYTVSASAETDDTHGVESNTRRVTADATAPTGTLTITAQMVH